MKPEFSRIKAVVMDIEGTTTPIDFVHRTLFSFAVEHAGSFLERNLGAQQVDLILSKLELSYKENSSGHKIPHTWSNVGTAQRLESATQYVKWLISVDSKDPALKELQGLIWEEGYRNHQLQGEVYADVPEAMERLQGEGIILAIYSSGSALAQRLIFGSTKYGDLTVYLSSFFDTSIGKKRDPGSYSNISRQLGIPPGKILFLSDIIEEVNAARIAGLMAVQVVREGHDTQKDTSQQTISSLLELFYQ